MSAPQNEYSEWFLGRVIAAEEARRSRKLTFRDVIRFSPRNTTSEADMTFSIRMSTRTSDNNWDAVTGPTICDITYFLIRDPNFGTDEYKALADREWAIVQSLAEDKHEAIHLEEVGPLSAGYNGDLNKYVVERAVTLAGL